MTCPSDNYLDMSELTIQGHSFRPLRDHILVQMAELEKMTASGIILPSTVTKESNFKGEIIAISKYDQENDTDYKLGRKVIVFKGSGIPISFDDNGGQEYKLFNKDEIKYVF